MAVEEHWSGPYRDDRVYVMRITNGATRPEAPGEFVHGTDASIGRLGPIGPAHYVSKRAKPPCDTGRQLRVNRKRNRIRQEGRTDVSPGKSQRPTT